MIRHCIVDTRTNKVVNIVDYENEIVGTPEGFDSHFIAMANTEGEIGSDYANGVIVNSAPVVVERTYAEKRAAEYPPFTDYIDGVVKCDQAQIDAYIAACQAIKTKYPKGA